MSQQKIDQLDSGAGMGNPRVDTSRLHVASPADATDATAPDGRLDAILRRADVRDRAAERRDREAERRDPADGDRHAAIDRDWAGRDRDRAAEDRGDLLALLRKALPRPPRSHEPGHDQMAADDVATSSSMREIRGLLQEISTARTTLAAAATAPGPMELLNMLTQGIERLAATQHELVNVLLDRGVGWDAIGRALDTSGFAAERRFPRRERRET